MTTPHHPHDLFFRATWSRLDVAQDFLLRYLPNEVQAVLDLASLELMKDSFVDETLRQHYSDLLYRLRTKEGHPIYAYLLLEHKSFPDRWVGFQLLRYIVRFWEQCVTDPKLKQLPPVIPLVLYHGKRGWQIPTQFQALVETPEILKSFIPDFNYQLCDLNKDTLNDLRNRTISRIAMLVLKYSLSEELPAQLEPILVLFREILKRPDGLAFLETVLRYLAQVTDKLDESEMQQALQHALPTIGETMMPTLAETWLERGRQEGRKAERQEAIEQERVLLRRLTYRRFGEGIAEQLTSYLEKINHTNQLAEIGEWIIDCENGDDLIRRVQKLPEKD